METLKAAADARNGMPVIPGEAKYDISINEYGISEFDVLVMDVIYLLTENRPKAVFSSLQIEQAMGQLGVDVSDARIQNKIIRSVEKLSLTRFTRSISHNGGEEETDKIQSITGNFLSTNAVRIRKEDGRSVDVFTLLSPMALYK